MRSGARRGNYRDVRAQPRSLARDAVGRADARRDAARRHVRNGSAGRPAQYQHRRAQLDHQAGLRYRRCLGAAGAVCANPPALGSIGIFEGRPLLFRQTRVGIRGKEFQLLKFRTMRAGGAEQVHREYVKNWIGNNCAGGEKRDGHAVFKLCNDPRITRTGAWLRKFSVDELPQLINVLRGEMSLIGPRPALPYELELYQDWHRHRLDAPPGITGLWQVSGRNRLSFDEMVQLDIEYVEDWSLYR